MLKRRTTDQDILHSVPRRPRIGAPVAPKRRPRREWSWRRSFVKLAIVGVGIYFAAAWIWRADRLRPTLEAALSERIGRKVHAGALRYSIGFGAVVARDL